MGLGRANVPERAASAAMLAQGCAAAAFPEATALPCIDVGKEILVRRIAMVIETQVHRLSIRADVAGAMMADSEVMDEARAEIEPGDKIIAAGNRNAVMSHAILAVSFAFGFQDDTGDSVEIPAEKDSAVSV